MSCREVHLRLCSLISDSLRTYAERIPSSFTKENARDLLIVLSQVCSQIKLWTSGIASESDSDMEGSGDFDCVIDFSIVNGSDTGGHLCLSKAINVLTKLLALDNPYVQHLVGNNLVAISDFIIASGSSWGEFTLLLSLLKLAILSSIPSSTGPIRVDANSAAPVSPIKHHHTSDNWSKASVIIQVLRRVLKGLKQDVDDHFLKVFLELMNSLISKMPWDLLDEVFVRKTSKASGSLNTDGVLQFQDAKQNPAIMFLGGFIQLFCSLLGLLSLPIDAVTDDSQTHTIVTEIRSILPRLLDWCLGNFQNIRSVYISEYYKHKFLILMIRLSSTIQSDCSVLLTWLHFIHLHFQDDLCLPIAGMESDQDNCLEGSPFWEYVSDAAKENISPRHLQRLAILLFLRCSFCLINSERSCQNCVSTDLNSSSTGNLKFEAQCCPRIIGFQEIHKWLQLISNDDAFLDTKKCAEFILSFQLSFIQLYMHEDDILFQMLLELLSVPLFSREWFFKEGIPSRDANASSVVLDLFNPIHLFHHFLAVIHYDHQVLLDYLISKDTGASSAEYMLRCLRVIFNSWSLFQNFQWIVKKEIQLFQMRRKTSIDHMNFHGELFTSVTDGICLPVEQNQKKPKRCGIINSRTERQPFECASNCLLELRTSIESLHQKSLFPYNPQVLLQRLSRFRELCQKQ